jgi:LAO/AO transport system ATPase
MKKEELIQCIHAAEEGEKYPLARLISEIEKKDSFLFRKELFQELSQNHSLKKNSITIGITGTPGAGKSSLIGELCTFFLKHSPRRKKLAVIAIDPSSKLTGGSILGDRTRVLVPARENRIFFRSQASQLDLGGVNPYTFHVIRLLRYFFDYILIETVGIGQNETEVSELSDFSFLILQPLAGDNIQFMKSGIMEVPDAFIINKCDEKELATASFHTLISSLEFLKDTLHGKTIPKIFQTSALKKIGIDTLLDFILNIHIRKDRFKENKDQLLKMIKNEYGNFGLRILSESNWNWNREYEELEQDCLSLIQEKIIYKNKVLL